MTGQGTSKKRAKQKAKPGRPKRDALYSESESEVLPGFEPGTREAFNDGVKIPRANWCRKVIRRVFALSAECFTHPLHYKTVCDVWLF